MQGFRHKNGQTYKGLLFFLTKNGNSNGYDEIKIETECTVYDNSRFNQANLSTDFSVRYILSDIKTSFWRGHDRIFYDFNGSDIEFNGFNGNAFFFSPSLDQFIATDKLDTCHHKVSNFLGLYPGYKRVRRAIYNDAGNLAVRHYIIEV